MRFLLINPVKNNFYFLHKNKAHKVSFFFMRPIFGNMINPIPFIAYNHNTILSNCIILFCRKICIHIGKNGRGQLNRVPFCGMRKQVKILLPVHIYFLQQRIAFGSLVGNSYYDSTLLSRFRIMTIPYEEWKLI